MSESCDQDYEIDVDKLIVLVQTSPELYNITLKNYHNQDYINKLWEDIAIEMNVPALRCKMKWQNLRGSYLRYLRDLTKLQSRSGSSKKKKWHLANAMEFIQPYVSPFKKSKGNFSLSGDVQRPTENNEYKDVVEEDVDEEDEKSSPSKEDPCQEPTEPVCLLSDPDNILEINPPKKSKKSQSDKLVEPMIAYLKSKTLHPPQEEDCLLLFLKSLHSDLKMLSSKRQRKFKLAALQELNKLLDEEENEEALASCSNCHQ